MKDEKFEKLFPSIANTKDKIWIMNGNLEFGVLPEGIVKYCLDKKKVKESIEKIHDLYTNLANNLNLEFKSRGISMSMGSKFHADLDKIEKELL